MILVLVQVLVQVLVLVLVQVQTIVQVLVQRQVQVQVLVQKQVQVQDLVVVSLHVKPEGGGGPEVREGGLDGGVAGVVQGLLAVGPRRHLAELAPPPGHQVRDHDGDRVGDRVITAVSSVIIKGDRHIFVKLLKNYAQGK